MASNLTAEEARALAALPGTGANAKPASVVARQFDQPLRLAPAELEVLREKTRKALDEAARELSSALRSPVALELIELVEANADSVSAALAPPFVALRFECARQPGWLVGDCKAALDALEVALGAVKPGENAPRALSPVERSTYSRLFGALTSKVAAKLGPKVERVEVCQDVESLGNWRQGGDHAEPQRLRLDIECAALGAKSQMRLYLPGIAPAANAPQKIAPQAPLPAHLGAVAVELKVVLGAARVPLADLLALEPGDVIPIEREVGETLGVSVEDRPCLRAKLGKTRGKLAIRIESIQRPPPGT